VETRESQFKASLSKGRKINLTTKRKNKNVGGMTLVGEDLMC
jgi:hypothetical protein